MIQTGKDKKKKKNEKKAQSKEIPNSVNIPSSYVVKSPSFLKEGSPKQTEPSAPKIISFSPLIAEEKKPPKSIIKTNSTENVEQEVSPQRESPSLNVPAPPNIIEVPKSPSKEKVVDPNLKNEMMDFLADMKKKMREDED